MSSFKKNRGFTLASVTVALAAMGLLTYTVNNLNDGRRNALAYETVISSSVIVGKALKRYYIENCAAGTAMVTPSMGDLISDGYIPTANAISNRLDISFTPQIINPGTPDAMVFVTANAPSEAIAAQLTDMAPNGSRIGTTVTYRFKPSMTATIDQVRVSQMNTYFGDTYCN